MAIKYGEKITIIDNDGGYSKGVIVDVWKDNSKEITDYIVQFDSGKSVRIKPDAHYSHELDDFVFTS